MATDIEQRIAAVRRFNRFYTTQIGVVSERHLASPFSLAEARVIYELAHRERSASELGKTLDLDTGYLSRTLKHLETRGLIVRTPSEVDGRQSVLALSNEGREAFSNLNARSHDKISTMLGALGEGEQNRLVASMHAIERLLGAGDDDSSGSRVPYLLRTHQPGDMGWIVHRHGILYGREYGWDDGFEALVARIAAEFIENFDARRERCWIAEREDEIVGSVFLVKKSDTAAKLRLLLVEPSARGLGIGKRLVSECTRFARQAGYRQITLWTNSVLTSARRLYEAEGYTLVLEEPHHSFGHDLVGQTWELNL